MAKPQFSLRAVFLTILVVAVVLALMFQAPILPANHILLAMVLVLSTFAYTGLVHGTSELRTFCIGASVPLSVMLVSIAVHTQASTTPFVITVTPVNPVVDEIIIAGSPRFFGMGILASIALGYLAVVFRWLIERSEK